MDGIVNFSFFFNDTATTEIYTLSLHDALPLWVSAERAGPARPPVADGRSNSPPTAADRKSTRLNSSHVAISYAVFCLKKKRKHRGAFLFAISQHKDHNK